MLLLGINPILVFQSLEPPKNLAPGKYSRSKDQSFTFDDLMKSHPDVFERFMSQFKEGETIYIKDPDDPYRNRSIQAFLGTISEDSIEILYGGSSKALSTLDFIKLQPVVMPEAETPTFKQYLH